MPQASVSTISIILSIPERHNVTLSTLAMGMYLPGQNLQQGFISIKSNYARSRTVEKTRTFYNKVTLRIHSEFSNRLLSVNVFATGSVQIAGIKDTAEIPGVTSQLSEILNSCAGTVSSSDIHRHPVYGFHLHGEIIYGVPLSGNKTGSGNDLWPIGVFRGDADRAFIHDTEMKLCKNIKTSECIFAPSHLRRRNPISGFFDCIGRRVTCTDGFASVDPTEAVTFTYNYSSTSTPVSSSMWAYRISMMNAALHFGKRVDLQKLSAAMRSVGVFVSYDPNVYRDINAKFKQGSAFIGTALITSSGYVRLYGFKDKSAIERAAAEIQNLMEPFFTPDR